MSEDDAKFFCSMVAAFIDRNVTRTEAFAMIRVRNALVATVAAIALARRGKR